MKLFIKHLSLFLALLLVACGGLILLAQFDNIDSEHPTNSNIARLTYQSQFEGLDILFIGNSYCYSAINPQILDSANLKSYNLSTSSAGADFYELIVEDYLAHTRAKPECIAFLISPMTFSSRADNFAAYPIHRYLQSPKSNVEVASELSNSKKIISLYRKSVKKAVKNLLNLTGEEVITTDSIAKSKGFTASTTRVNWKLMKQNRYRYLSRKNDNFNHNDLTELLKLSESLSETGIKVTFVEVPTNDLLSFFNNQYKREYKKTLQLIDSEYVLIQIDKENFTLSDYRNRDHMNSQGAQKATKEFLHLLKNSDEIQLDPNSK